MARNSEVRRFSYPWPGRGVCQLQEGVARRVMDLVQSLEKLRARVGAVPGLLKLQHPYGKYGISTISSSTELGGGS